ncbi:hypothetical protein BD408DRAFT_411351 [Parasitella parasitica]|nr:hypothetical protein BD408DRAFT_411351 [Parasitella parasitica]
MENHILLGVKAEEIEIFVSITLNGGQFFFHSYEGKIIHPKELPLFFFFSSFLELANLLCIFVDNIAFGKNTKSWLRL